MKISLAGKTAVVTGASRGIGLAVAKTLGPSRAGRGHGGNCRTVLTGIFPEGKERNRALGALGSISSPGFTLGLIQGGILTGTLGWRWVFYVKIPIGAMASPLPPG